MEIEIIPPSEPYFKSFHAAVDQVAREQIYIEMIEAKSLEETIEFQKKMIANDRPGRVLAFPPGRSAFR